MRTKLSASFGFGLVLAGGILLTSNGCALFTAQRVGTFVATQAGKKVVKDIKEDHDQKKAAEAQQQQQGYSQDSSQGELQPMN